MDLRKKEQSELFEVPYLLIDPQDIGRTYEAIIRINSQSGKGGVAYVLSRDFGLELPKSMHPEVGNIVNEAADQGSRELSSDEVHAVFMEQYVNLTSPLNILGIEREDFSKTGDVRVEADITMKGEEMTISGTGNGPISAFVDAMEQKGWKDFTLLDYRQHSIGGGSKTKAAAYIQISHENGDRYFGCGIDANIELAGLRALVSAFNRACSTQ